MYLKMDWDWNHPHVHVPNSQKLLWFFGGLFYFRKKQLPPTRASHWPGRTGWLGTTQTSSHHGSPSWQPGKSSAAQFSHCWRASWCLRRGSSSQGVSICVLVCVSERITSLGNFGRRPPGGSVWPSLVQTDGPHCVVQCERGADAAADGWSGGFWSHLIDVEGKKINRYVENMLCCQLKIKVLKCLLQHLDLY